RLARQSPVREHEAVEAALNSRGEFVLTDDTKLVLGPGARLVLDEFTYVPNQRAASKVIVNFALSAFPFITSSSSPEAYEIKTPAATIGIRGTIFDGFVAGDGGMVLLLHRHRPGVPDQIRVCPNHLPSNCEPLRSPCHLLYVTASGRVLPQKPNWDSTMLPGVDVRTAFPFLERRPAVDPIIRCRYADLFTPDHVRKALAPPMPQPTFAPPPSIILGIGTVFAVPFVKRRSISP